MFEKTISLQSLAPIAATLILLFISQRETANGDVPRCELKGSNRHIYDSINNKSSRELWDLLQSGDCVLTRTATHLLAERKDQSFAPFLRDQLRGTNKTAIRYAAMFLGEMRDKEAVVPLVKLIETAAIGIEKEQPLLALCKIGDPATISLIESEIDDIAFAGHDWAEDKKLQDAYIDMKIRGLDEDAKLQELLSILKNKKIGFIVEDQIANMGTKAVPELISLVGDKKNRFGERLVAVKCLGRIGDARGITALLAIAADEKETDHLRWNVIHSIGITNSKDAIPVLNEIIIRWKPKTDAMTATTKDGKRVYVYDVRGVAIETLTKIKGQLIE